MKDRRINVESGICASSRVGEVISERFVANPYEIRVEKNRERSIHLPMLCPVSLLGSRTIEGFP
jgi:hypothetical protein